MENICDLFLKREEDYLSPYAFLTKNTQGREKEIAPCRNRTEFQRDRDRITHSQAFRRLMNKTQVFLAPLGDHYRTRLTHTLEVTQIARTIARSLDLNEDLAAEQKARVTYDNILRLTDDPDVRNPIKFLREREVVHYQRFGDCLRRVQERADHKNIYGYNPAFDKRRR